MLFLLVFIASTIQLALVEARRERHRNHNAVVEVSSTQVEIAIYNLLADLGSAISSTPTFQVDAATPIIPVDPTTITPSPTLSPSSASTCVPSSICFDGFTCSVRYGGCYDKNFCDGNTSPYPIPTCNSSPSLGLSANNMNIEEPVDRISGASVAQDIAEDLVEDEMEHGQWFTLD